MDPQTLIAEIARSILPEQRASAKTFQDAVESALKERGCVVKREHIVDNRGDGRRGFIDLVIEHPFRAAIELDNHTPRHKSVFKLRQFLGDRFILLRSTPSVILTV